MKYMGTLLYYLQFFFKSKTVLKQKVNLKDIKLIIGKKYKPNHTFMLLVQTLLYVNIFLQIFGPHSQNFLLRSQVGDPEFAFLINSEMLILLVQKWYFDSHWPSLEDESHITPCYLSCIYKLIFPMQASYIADTFNYCFKLVSC